MQKSESVNPTSVFIDIDYDEFEPETYRGVRITPFRSDGPKFEERVFSSGDVVVDYREAVEYGATVAAKYQASLMTLSSVGHFVMDSSDYGMGDDGLIRKWDS